MTLFSLQNKHIQFTIFKNKLRKMIYLFCLLINVLILFSSCQKEKLLSSTVDTFSINSVNTNSTYTIQVCLPEGYTPSKKYETVYLLDGESQVNIQGETPFVHTANECQNRSKLYGKQNCIVVGIGGSEFRGRDYTPTSTSFQSDGGGAEKYTQFLENELIKKIQKQYSVDTTAKSRLIIGHSFGGLFTTFLYTKHPKLFSNYLTLSPSLFYDNDLIMTFEKDARSQLKTNTNLVFIGFGELETLIGIYAQEWHFRLSTFYPNNKTMVHKNAHFHTSSELDNISMGLDFYFKNK
jgi:uncharacterized protein